MKIKYIGHSCFLLETNAGTRILIDPFDGIGRPMPAVRAEYICCTHGHFDHNYVAGVQGCRAVVSTAGEHTCGDAKIVGIPSFHDDVCGRKRGSNIIYRVEADGAAVCHMGDIGQEPTGALLAAIGTPDVLLIPVGGTYTVDAAGALEYVRAIRPKIVVPMHYKTADCTLDIAPVGGFTALCGKENCAEADSIDTDAMGEYLGKTIIMRRLTDGR